MGSISSGWVSRAAKRGRCRARRSCRAARARPGTPSRPSSGRLPPGPRTASRASPTWVRAAPGTTSRWSTTGSSTATCSSSPRCYDLLAPGARLHRAGAGRRSSASGIAASCRSYLVEITAAVLAHTDADTGRPLVDLILDEAQQKGTGKWMSQNAFDVGAPIPTVNAAVEARLLSALKRERVEASRRLRGPGADGSGRASSGAAPAAALRAARGELIAASRQALYASKITSYAQGMALLRRPRPSIATTSTPAEVAGIWRAGCIIRAALLSDIQRGVPARSGAGQPDARRRVPRRSSPSGRRDGAASSDGRRPRHPGAGHGRLAGLLRRLSQRTAAGQPHAGAARLLRRAHLSAASTATACSTRTGWPVRGARRTHERSASHSASRRTRFPVSRRTGPSPRSGRGAVPQGADLRDPRERRRVQHRRQSLRLLPDEDRRRHRHGGLSHRPSHRRAGAGHGREGRSTRPSRTTARAGRTWRRCTATAATASARPWCSTTAATRRRRSSSPATSTGRRSSAPACAGSTAAASSRPSPKRPPS